MDEMATIPGAPVYSAKQRNRCSTCGFLAIRVLHLPTQPPLEAGKKNRDTGDLWQHLGGSGRPHCIVYAADLYGEVADGVDLKGDSQAVWAQTKSVIDKERDGSAWFPWTPFFSPKEHMEQRNMLQLEQQRAALRIRLAEMDRDSRAVSAKIQAQSLEISKTLASVASSTDRFQRRWTRAAVVLAVAALVVVAGTWIFPDLGRHIGQWIDQVLGYPLGRG